ncbi:MAG: class I SAM-dependent methyltransferase [Gammaproteobacteria bacterium]|nr:class I SAM-dependent methyltransferase [Bacteroidetes Order II. bacterium]MBT7878879.1 class I SAM-dependent methyltransferase [Gammaproteobacteria bacterium]
MRIEKLTKRWVERAVFAFIAVVPERWLKHLLFLLKSRPELTDLWGYHIRPIHYYDPVPDFRMISEDSLLQSRKSTAINYQESQQAELIRYLGMRFGDELRAQISSVDGFDFSNSFFSGFDAAVYFSVIRHLLPARIIEIGAGYSTQIAALALQANSMEGRGCDIISIEPYPEARLLEFGVGHELVQERVQDLPLTFFDQLCENDILFIDSSHVASTGSDVCFEYLQILPRLKPGVWVHVHDVFLPMDYPPKWVLERRLAFNEQYLLEAFLAYNKSFVIKIANAMLVRESLEECQSLFGGRNLENSASSFWMKKED